jgi:hypothetical protein
MCNEKKSAKFKDLTGSVTSFLGRKHIEMSGSLLMLSGLAEFLETALMNVLVFWNITPCRLVGRYQLL